MERVIGGMFPLEKIGNGSGFPWIGKKDVLFLMSGRCALYASLLDIGDVEPKRAYVPAYTCETVLSAYVKAGYELRFYDIDPEGMTPLFREEELDGVSVLGLCGYFGFCRYDRDFLLKCKDRGIKILFDTTHSPLKMEELADYQAGSLRKWMGIASGGVAVKMDGAFNVKPLAPEKAHLDGRYRALELRQEALDTGEEKFNEEASEVFWNTELRLRKMFDAFSGDELSERIIRNFDFDSMVEKRRENYQMVLDGINSPSGFSVVFDSLREDDVPSHFTVYADDRPDFQAYLKERGISSTVYWPRTPESEEVKDFDSRYPGAAYIYDHVCSVQIDQRYGKKEMDYLASVLSNYRK